MYCRRGYVRVVNRRLEKSYRAVVFDGRGHRESRRVFPTAGQAEDYGRRLMMRLASLRQAAYRR